MVGLINITNWNGGNTDLAKKIASLGKTDTPLFAEIAKYVPEKSAERWQGHQWKYEEMPTGDDDNAHLSGSAPAGAVAYGYQDSTNHYQIIKDTFGVTGSMEDAKNIEGSPEFQRQKLMAGINHRLTIEKALFKAGADPVKEVEGTTAGKMGSLDHWCTVANTLDAGASAINDTKIRDFMKYGGTKGMPVTHMFMNDKVKDQIDDLFKSEVRRGAGEKVMEFANYTEIRNLAYSPSVKIIYTDKVAQGTVYGVNMPSLGLVYHRLTKEYELGRVDDSYKKEFISELTLRVNNPLAVSKIANIAV